MDDSMQDIFRLATDGFADFFAAADKASSGNGSKAASSGNYSRAASSGDYSTAASSGNGSKAASSGNGSTAASSGSYSKAASSGENAGCSALGYRAAVRGSIGNLIMASEYSIDGVPLGGKASLVDGVTVKPDCWYIVEGGEWVEVDFTDGIFSRVLSSRGSARKVQADNGKVWFIVGDGNGNFAHGDTIKQARQDLIYKVCERGDVAIPESATGREWVGIYRGITGACSAGVRGFVEAGGYDLDATYTSAQVAEMVKGAFGADKFASKLSQEG